MPDTQNPVIQSFFDPATSTISYLVADPATRQAAIIDPVLDFQPNSGKVQTRSADALLAAAAAASLKVVWILETHAHADHLSAAIYLRKKTGAKIAIGKHISDVQKIFIPVFNLRDVSGKGSEFDHLFKDGERFSIGTLKAEVIHTPGHTPACISYKIGDAIFVGDTLFMPDYGTARADFPGGDAQTLYRSIRKLLKHPPETRLFMCHDYKPQGRDKNVWESTIKAQRQANIHIHDGVSEEEFVVLRKARDAGLPAPQLLLPSIQVNIRAGAFPPAEKNGTSYLKIPIRPAAP